MSGPFGQALGLRLLRIISEKKVGLLPVPSISAEVSAYMNPGSIFEAVEEWDDIADGRRYLRLAHGRGWIPMCSRKDERRPVVAQAEDPAVATGNPDAKLFSVISDKKVGVLPKPDSSADASAYLAPGGIFVVVEECNENSDNRTYVRLANGHGWVATCSRKDPTKPVIAEVKSQCASIDAVGAGTCSEVAPDEVCMQAVKEVTETSVCSSDERAAGDERRPRDVTSPHTPPKTRGRKRVWADSANKKEADAETSSGILPRRLDMLKPLVARALVQLHNHEMPCADLMASVVSSLAEGEVPFTEDECSAGLIQLEKLNKIMRISGNIVLIS